MARDQQLSWQSWMGDLAHQACHSGETLKPPAIAHGLAAKQLDAHRGIGILPEVALADPSLPQAAHDGDVAQRRVRAQRLVLRDAEHPHCVESGRSIGPEASHCLAQGFHTVIGDAVLEQRLREGADGRRASDRLGRKAQDVLLNIEQTGEVKQAFEFGFERCDLHEIPCKDTRGQTKDRTRAGGIGTPEPAEQYRVRVAGETTKLASLAKNGRCPATAIFWSLCCGPWHPRG